MAGKAFTLMELIIVVIVIGILASIGIPQYFRVSERGRAAEAVAILGSLRSAQLRYASQFGTTTGTLSRLDVEYTPLRFFNTPVLRNGVSPAGGNTWLAYAYRNSIANPGFGNYYLMIYINGTIFCGGGASGACRKLGY